jgi:hypothetical protein
VITVTTTPTVTVTASTDRELRGALLYARAALGNLLGNRCCVAPPRASMPACPRQSVLSFGGLAAACRRRLLNTRISFAAC